MPFRRRTLSSYCDSRAVGESPAIARLWTLRILVTLNGHRNFIQSYGFSNDNLAHALGLGKWIDDELREARPKGVIADLRKSHRQAMRKSGVACVPDALATNIAQLAGLADLSATASRLLEFVALMNTDAMLKAAAQCLKDLSIADACNALAVILDLPEGDIRASLRHDSTLMRSGLLELCDRACDLDDKIQLTARDFAEQVILPDMEPIDLLRGVATSVAPAELDLDDYPHLATPLDLLLPYLRHAIESGRNGVNVFLYGPPGTGKTQLARVLAQRLESALFEIASENDDGDPKDGKSRLSAMRAAQCFFGKGRALLLFDEVEDVFGGGLFHRSVAQQNKGWMNRMLEGNGVPTLWVANAIDNIDPAFMRRFDMVLEVPVPPRRQRERMMRGICGDLVNAASIARFAESETLAPAVVARAAGVVRAIAGDMDRAQASAATELLIDNTLEAQGHKQLRIGEAARLPDTYDPGFINADADLALLAEGLAHSRSGRLCLYGPPGTGKTAYARWLAQHLDMPLIVKRASDLMSMWLGESEKNMARAFRQAEQEGALLLIDEVDSFLQDRRNAQRSWEVTQVNEMLTQMEAFSGIFIASTNLMEGLDQAALRRFDLKVKFDFLKPVQAAGMLRRHCETLGIPEPAAAEDLVRKRLRSLTPGDFAAVMRQHRFRRITGTDALVAALQAECAARSVSMPAAIGFVH